MGNVRLWCHNAKLPGFLILSFLKRQMLKWLESDIFICVFLHYRETDYVQKQKQTSYELSSARVFNPCSVALMPANFGEPGRKAEKERLLWLSWIIWKRNCIVYSRCVVQWYLREPTEQKLLYCCACTPIPHTIWIFCSRVFIYQCHSWL